MHVDRRALADEILQGLGLRTRTTRADAAGPAESHVRQRLTSPLRNCTGIHSEFRLDEGNHRPSDLARAIDHRDRRSLEGAALPRVMGGGGSQAAPRHSPPPPPPPWNPPTQLHQQRPPGRFVDPEHQPRVIAGNADAPATPSAAMLVDRGPSDQPVMILSPSFPALDGGATAAATAPRWVDSGGTSGATGGPGHVCDYRGHSRAASRPQSRWNFDGGEEPLLGGRTACAEGSRVRDRESLVGGAGNGVGSGEVAKYGGGGNLRSPVARGWWQSPKEASSHHHHQNRLTPSSPGRAKRKWHPGGGGGVAGVEELPSPCPPPRSGEHQHGTPFRAAPPPPLSTGKGGRSGYTGSLPSTPAPLRGGGHGGAAPSLPVEERTSVGIDAPFPSAGSTRHPRWHSRTPSSNTTEAISAMAMLGRPPSWGSGAPGGRGHGESRPTQAGAGSSSPELGGGGRWSGAESHGRSAGADTGRDFDRELAHGDRLPLASPPRDLRHHPRSSRHRHSEPDRCSPPRSVCFPPRTTITPPRSDHAGRGVGPATQPSSACRSSLSGVLDSVQPPPPLQGLAKVTAIEGGPEAGSCRSLAVSEPMSVGPRRCRESAGEGAAGASAGTGAGATTERGHSEQQRFGNKLMKLSNTKGCAEEGCDQRARLAFKGSRKPAYCERHGAVGMVDLRHPRCEYQRCIRQPSFGMEGDRRASYCAGHKKAGMVNVSSRRCEKAGCIRHPNFGFPGDRRALYCKQHLETGMVDVVSRRCQGPSCMRRPLYNMEGLRPVFCSQHKLPRMIDVVSARCQEPGCLRHPSFGYVSDMKARRCARHRLENMESVKGRHQKNRRGGGTSNTSAGYSTSCPAPSCVASSVSS